MILAAGDRARELRERPAWIRGIDHRIEPMAPRRARPHDVARRPARAGEKAGVGTRPVDVAELHAPFSPQELILREALGLGDDGDVNPSGGALAANPVMVAGLIRIGEVAQRIMDGTADRGVAHATSGPVPAAEPRLRPGRGGLMAKERVAVVGIGQTKHQATRGDVSMAGLVREAADARPRRRRA